MISPPSYIVRSILLALCVAWVIGGFVPALAAEEIKVEARLIWGANESHSKNPKHKPVDKKTAQKLQKIFKWKHYFLEKKLVEKIPHRATKNLVMSKDCTVAVKELAGPSVEFKLIGKGKPVNKTTKPFNKGEWIVIGGDDTNECAWFVILIRL